MSPGSFSIGKSVLDECGYHDTVVLLERSCIGKSVLDKFGYHDTVVSPGNSGIGKSVFDEFGYNDSRATGEFQYRKVCLR